MTNVLFMIINMIDIVYCYFYRCHDYIDKYGNYEHTYLTSYNTIIDIIITLIMITLIL